MPPEIWGLYIYGFGGKVVKAANYSILAQRAPSILTLRDAKEHRRRRHRVALALGEDNVRFYEPQMLNHIRTFCAKMVEGVKNVDGWSVLRNMAPWYISERRNLTPGIGNYLLFDIMMSMVFSSDSKLLTHPKYRHIPNAIHQSSVLQGVLVQDKTLAILGLHKYLFKTAMRERVKFVHFIRTVLGIRLKNSASYTADSDPCHDVFAYLRNNLSSADLAQLSPKELSAECATLIIAGSDTSTMGLAGALFYLSRYRSAYDRLAQEIREKFNDASDIRLGKTLYSCSYLKSCIQETLRISPPVGTALWREVEPENGATIDGTVIPKGTHVGVGIYSIHHKPNHFSDPFTFRPERWLSEARPADLVNHETRAYGPFSIGPRSCVGKGIAMQELMLSLAHIFWSLDFEALGPDGNRVTIEGSVLHPSPGWTEFPMKEYIIAVGDGPMLRFRRRAVE
uniref:Cytochrome P450 67 n=1 Tax=Coccidioides posadasii RMSCC 3488 TaxID=454284 RepID=A0A0J6FNB2_COCPO|nr:cytochrome P450 67 [Coccidioides posadasii RMSCC 3488]